MNKYGEYIFDEDRDHEIIEKAERLERKNLSDKDREIVELIKTQLVDNWRKLLLDKLDQLLILNRYK